MTLSFWNKNLEHIPLGEELRQGTSSIERIAAIQKKIILSECDNIAVDMGETEFISPALIPVIASMPKMKIGNKNIKIAYNKENTKITELLQSQGVFKYYRVSANEEEKM